MGRIWWICWLLSPVISCGLDWLLGDPYVWPHPVKWMGGLISRLEPRLRRRYPDSPAGRRYAGRVLVVLTTAAAALTAAAGLLLAALIHPWLALAVQVWFGYQLLAARCMIQESARTRAHLLADDLPAARYQTGMLVGRETAGLDAADLIRANVETLAENTTDGVIAPLFWMAVGGLPLMAVYKAINTMDSMVGYRDERYLDFGRAAALTDDAANFVPARLAAVLMILAAALHPKLSGTAARRCFRRDRFQHLSPNSAQTESVCAGALGIRLGGPHVYFGEIVDKPWIGNGTAEPAVGHIRLAEQLLAGTAHLFCLLIALGATALAVWIL